MQTIKGLGISRDENLLHFYDTNTLYILEVVMGMW